MILDTSHHSFSNVDCIEANILIDKDGNARLADFGLLTIIYDSTHAANTSLSQGHGTLRWMSPELIDPKQFGAKKRRPTKESDCYALGMVVLEVLTGKYPFSQCDNLEVMKKIIERKHPHRPTGPEAVWFTDDLWAMLEQCWSHKPEERPTVDDILECLKRRLATWKPLPLIADSGSRGGGVDSSASAIGHRSCVFFRLVFDLDSPEQRST